MMKRSIIILCCLSVSGLWACESKQTAPRPSGLKNMAPLSIQEAVQDGLDTEPNNTFLQAINVTMTGDVMHWAGKLEADDIDVWHIKAKAGTVADILVTPEGEADIIVDYAPSPKEERRRYYDSGVASKAELLPNIRLTPQGGYVTIRSRHTGEAVGYRLSVSRVLSQDGSSVVEAEPNDVYAEALVVTMPNKVEGSVYPAGDVDYWRVPISTPSAISFTMPDGAYELAVEHQNKVIWSLISRQAQVVRSDILKPELREVSVRIKSLEDVQEVKKYGVEVTSLNKVPDEIEPNDTIELAQKIQSGSKSIEFSLRDTADVDIFQVSLDPQQVYSAYLVGPEPGQARIQVLSSAGISRSDVMGDGQAICDAKVTEEGGLWFKVMPGVGVTSWPLSYRIVMEGTPISEVEVEPNQLPEQACAIALGTTLKGHIFPVGDVDTYKISLPQYAGVEGPIGTLSVDVEGGYVAKLQLMLQDSAGYEISQASNTQYSRPIHLEFDAPNGEYLLVVSGSGDGCIKPYHLKVGFEPNAAALASVTAAAENFGVQQGGNEQPGNAAAEQGSVPVGTEARVNAGQAVPGVLVESDMKFEAAAAAAAVPTELPVGSEVKAEPMVPSVQPEVGLNDDLAIEALIQAAQEMPSEPSLGLPSSEEVKAKPSVPADDEDAF